MDFSIIPEKSVKNDKDGEYLDLRNTSGPYYLNVVKDNHQLELRPTRVVHYIQQKCLKK